MNWLDAILSVEHCFEYLRELEERCEDTPRLFYGERNGRMAKIGCLAKSEEVGWFMTFLRMHAYENDPLEGNLNLIQSAMAGDLIDECKKGNVGEHHLNEILENVDHLEARLAKADSIWDDLPISSIVIKKILVVCCVMTLEQAVELYSLTTRPADCISEFKENTPSIDLKTLEDIFYKMCSLQSLDS